MLWLTPFMITTILRLLFIALVCFGLPSFVRGSELLSAISPKLKQFVTTHSGTLQTLTNNLSEAFNGKTIQVFYYYTEDESVARAYHYYTGEGDSMVGICVRENQEPLDEFISLIFESQNTKGEKQFKELYRKAESGDISKTAFAQEMLKVEFNAVKSTRDLLRRLKFGKKEMGESFFYKRFSECPEEFSEFMIYTAKVSLHGDPIKEFEAKYDSLRKP
jgi:hypothetical protein